ncbi:MAG: zinc-ribbon domain-containing protein [Lachnospiraceae bacterium]|nr:zinc-ribbon domain-containing protein [Lachnospiraceae bacterium]
MILKCKQCEKEFELTDSEIDFYNSKGLEIPKRCKACRDENKTRKRTAWAAKGAGRPNDGDAEQTPRRRGGGDQEGLSGGTDKADGTNRKESTGKTAGAGKTNNTGKAGGTGKTDSTGKEA